MPQFSRSSEAQGRARAYARRAAGAARDEPEPERPSGPTQVHRQPHRGELERVLVDGDVKPRLALLLARRR